MTKSTAVPPPAFEIIHRPDDVHYKVWVIIERIGVDWRGDESFEDIGLADPIGVFDSLEEAQEHLRSLPGWYPDGSDHRLPG